ncbi:MAG: YfcE family phosphodiesterase [Methanomassiliicoccales archaeon]|nr:YfcE family phosphodiesterase [Methanomassiliicoccales archaeon]
MGRDELCQFGRQAARERLDALLEEVEGVHQGEDIEHVHRMRVASRRLRSALRIFGDCFKGKKGKRWRQAAKEVTTSLGQARDLDVQIDFLSGMEGAEDLQPLIAHLKEGRTAMQPAICALMDQLSDGSPLLELKVELEGGEDWNGPPAALRPYAYTHAAVAVEELFEHAHSVPVYSDWQGHHALRIAAKRLRYALEAFRKAYDDGLDEELRELKKMQDVVGELHDCDIWLQRIPLLRKELPAVEGALDHLQVRLEGRRKELHGRLMETWYALTQERFFYRLLEKLKGHGQEEVCPVNVALISDVHGNAAALRAVLAHARDRGVSAILHAGDAVGLPEPDLAIDMLRGADVMSVSGNMDRDALEARQRKTSADAQLGSLVDAMKERSWDWIESLPKEVRLDICGRTLFMTHAAPDDEQDKLLPGTPESRLEDIAQEVKADVIVTGHSHVPMEREVSRTLFVNPGSVGRPRNGPKASYATLTFPELQLQHHLVEYDASGTAEEVRTLGLNDLAEDIAHGHQDDRTVAVGEWAMSLHPDQVHVEQVRTMTMLLFDQTHGLHRLKEGDRELLELAALVHDVGWSQGREGHQRRSLDLVMKADLPLDCREKMIVGCVARYHGTRAPRDTDRVFRDLKEGERKRVRKMSALLALADSLDRGHDSRVAGVSMAVGRKEVRLQLKGVGTFELEREWVGRKKGQFERAFKRRVRIGQ